VTGLEWLFSGALVWSVWFAYCAVDAPTLAIRWKRGRR
jgi:hypothetical protein